jgi:hypothetical protein
VHAVGSNPGGGNRRSERPEFRGRSQACTRRFLLRSLSLRRGSRHSTKAAAKRDEEGRERGRPGESISSFAAAVIEGRAADAMTRAAGARLLARCSGHADEIEPHFLRKTTTCTRNGRHRALPSGWPMRAHCSHRKTAITKEQADRERWPRRKPATSNGRHLHPKMDAYVTVAGA